MNDDYLNVLWQDELVGQLLNTKPVMHFLYASTWLESAHAFPLSYSLALREEKYREAAHNYFSNLLPEGQVRMSVAHANKISPENDFELLKILGAECAGAIQIRSTKELEGVESGYHPISKDKIETLQYVGTDVNDTSSGRYRRFSLAGAQDKCAIFIKDGDYYLPKGNAPSSHIIKFQSQDKLIKFVPENEFISTLYLKYLGMNVVPCELFKFKRGCASCHARYDRIPDAPFMKRIHQEDACQCLGIPTSSKYENEGGPSLADIASLIRSHCSIPAMDISRLIDWVVGNLLIRNGDAHGKNISILYHNNNTISTAPFYDMVCTDLYKGKIDTRLAMKVGGQTDPAMISYKDVDQFASNIGVKTRFVVNRISHWLHQAPDAISHVFAIPEVAALHPAKQLEKIFSKQAKHMLRICKER